MLELKENQEFKNYKELCEFMNWKYYSGGTSKKAQFKELETLCEYHKQGNKIVIDKVFKEKKEKIDNRKNNHGNSAEYIDILESLLLGEMLMNDCKIHNRLFIGKSVLLRDVGLVNWNYSFCKRRPKKLAEYLGVSEDTVVEYFNLNNKSLMNDLERALKNLKNKGLIDLNTSTIICKNETQVVDYIHDIVIDEFDEEIDNIKAKTIVNKVFVEATEKERNLIVKAKIKVLKDMNIDKITTVFALGKTKEYYSRISKELRKDIKDLNFFFDAYDIVYEYEYIVKELNNIGYNDWDNDIKQFLIEVVNLGVIKKIDINSIRRHNKSESSKKYIGIPNKINKKDYTLYNRSRKEYINENNTISNNVICIHADNIKKDVAQTKIK